MNCSYLPWRFVMIAGLLISSFSSSAQSSLVQETPTASQSAVEADKLEVYKAGKDISAPILIHSVDPKVSKVARRANLRAIVYVNCYIEPDGTTSNVHAAQTMLDINAGPINEPVTKELEDAAVDAVKHYKFKPSKKDEKPVRVELNIVVHFGS
jgi:hypothetical protein